MFSCYHFLMLNCFLSTTYLFHHTNYSNDWLVGLNFFLILLNARIFNSSLYDFDLMKVIRVHIDYFQLFKKIHYFSIVEFLF